MPPKQKSPTEKLKLERRQLRRTFTKIYNETSSFIADKTVFSNEEIARLKSAFSALHTQFKDCNELEKQLRDIVLDEIENEDELDAFFDEVDEVASVNRGKLTKLEFVISKYDSNVCTPSSTSKPEPSSSSYSRSKLPDINLPTFNGNITEWFGFWERFQSQVGESPDLPNAAKFTYLIGQLKGEALTTVKGLTPSDQNYKILVTTLKENFGLPRRIIRAHVLNILKLPKPTHIVSSLRHFYNTLMGDIRSLKALKIDVSACAPFIVPIIEEKLPGTILSALGDCGKDSQFDLDQFVESFKDYILRHEQAHSSNALQASESQLPFGHEVYQPPSTLSTMAAPISNCCQLCNSPHSTQRCPLSASEKQAIVHAKKLCLNCLRSGHRVVNCEAKGRCAKCKGKHHTAIHGIQIHRNTNPTSPRHNASICAPPSQSKTHVAIASSDQSLPPGNVTPMPQTSQPTIANCASVQQSSDIFVGVNDNCSAVEPIFLKTAKAVAVSAERKLTARIFFDEGSQRSYIRTAFASDLNAIPTSYETLSVCSFGGSVTEKTYGITQIGLETPTGIENVSLLVTDEIVQPLSQQYYSAVKSDPRLYDLHLANDYSDSSFVVDILLGADAAFRFLGNISDPHSEPIIQESKFGHVLSGPLPKLSKLNKDTSIPIHEMSTPTIDLPATWPHLAFDYQTLPFRGKRRFHRSKRRFQHRSL